MAKNKKLVIDASVVLAVILEEPEKIALISVTESTTLLAPGCLRWEVGNAFSAMLKRKRLNLELASKGVSIFKTIPIQEVEVALSNVMELCDRHNIYAYDAYYLQLAKKASIPLLTLDQKMALVAKKENIQVKEIL